MLSHVFFVPSGRVGERGGEEWQCAASELNGSARSSPASPCPARTHRENGVSSPERPQEVREPNYFFPSNMATHAAKALQRDALCICERRIMLDSRADSSLRVPKLAIS